MRQGRARRAGRCRAADVADGRAHGRRHERVTRAAARSLPAFIAVAVAAAVPAASAIACADFAAAPSTRWSLATEHGVSWLVTPCGEQFFSLGVNILDGGYPEREKAGKIYYTWKAFEPTLEDWTAKARWRLSSWGFNSAGGWALPPQELKL